jgi:cell division septation protein DedD
MFSFEIRDKSITIARFKNAQRAKEFNDKLIKRGFNTKIYCIKGRLRMFKFEIIDNGKTIARFKDAQRANEFNSELIKRGFNTKIYCKRRTK